MKTILLSLTAAAALAAAVSPAAAQPYGYRPAPAYSHANTSYIDRLDWKITNAARQHRISWQEARDLRMQLRQVQPLAYGVQTGQANRWERQRLDRTVSRIEFALNSYARNDRPDWRR
jgi:hypothetical protein